MVYHCFANIHPYNPILVINTMEPWSQCGNSMSFPTSTMVSSHIPSRDLRNLSWKQFPSSPSCPFSLWRCTGSEKWIARLDELDEFHAAMMRRKTYYTCGKIKAVFCNGPVPCVTWVPSIRRSILVGFLLLIYIYTCSIYIILRCWEVVIPSRAGISEALVSLKVWINWPVLIRQIMVPWCAVWSSELWLASGIPPGAEAQKL